MSKPDLKIFPMPLSGETEDKRIGKLDNRLFGHPFRMLIVASSGGGKSSFIYSLLKQKKMYGDFFDKILIWNGSPRYNEQYQALPNTEVFNDYDEAEIKSIYDEIKALQKERKDNNKRYLRILFVFDDYSSFYN